MKKLLLGSSLGSVLSLGLAVFANVASAQDAQPVVIVQQQEAAPAPVVYQQQVPPPGYYIQPAREDRVRFRGGFAFGFYGMALSGYSSYGGSIAGQVGLQFNDMFALYYQPAFGITVGDFVGVSFNNTVMAEVTIADRFQIGVGPSLDIIGLGVNTPGGPSSGAASRPALNARLAYVFGSEGPGRRSGLAIAAEYHPLFGDNGSVLHIFGVNLGYVGF